jgi:hypothetical protein
MENRSFPIDSTTTVRAKMVSGLATVYQDQADEDREFGAEVERPK